MTAIRSALLFACALLFLVPSEANAQLTSAQQKVLSGIRADMTRAGLHIRRKNYEVASKMVEDAQAQLDQLVKETGLQPTNRIISGVQRVIDLRKTTLSKVGAAPKPGGDKVEDVGVSFVSDVAPIVQKRCAGCHGPDGSGGLDLSTFNGMRKGGANGVLLIPGKSATSLLHQRLIANGPARMPKRGNALPAAEIETIKKWIDEGAKFDGTDMSVALNNLKKVGGTDEPKVETKTDVKILKPTGSETVSFTKDIAPFMVNICMRCHSGNNPRGGFSMETFEKMMIGGSSGRVIIPGNLDGSRMWDLAGKQQPIKMPPGQALITRSNHSNLRTWIQEGARFDGKDPKAPLRELVPTEEELRAAELAKMSKEEWQQMRLKKSQDMWSLISPKDPGRYIETKEFFIYGAVSEARLTEVGKWAEAQAAALRKNFNDKSEQLWKGKLTLFVSKDRFGYEEFNFAILRRRTPPEQYGHAVVSSTYEDAYAAVQDVGENVTEKSPGMQLAVIEQVTKAFFARGGGKLPGWIVEGTGLALAGDANRDNEYLEALEGSAADFLKGIRDPASIFADGQFSPAGTRAVGYTLVRYLVGKGGAARFGTFVGSLKQGTDMKAAVKGTYRLELNALAAGYARSL